MKRLVVLTGASGAGVTSARIIFEELGYYIVEGAPIDTIPYVLTSFKQKKYKTDLFCLIVGVQDASKVLEIAKKDELFETSLCLLTTSKEILLKRYALTRHTHPRCVLTKITLEKAIDADIKDAISLYPDADFTIDTTSFTPKELRRQLLNRFKSDDSEEEFTVTFMSFGLKNGLPMALDMLFDVRNIPNPYWIPALKELTGLDQPVIDYMLSFPKTQEYLDELVEFLEYQLKETKASERSSYIVGIACSGGQHRSTFVADYLAKHFANRYKTIALHRDSPELNER